MTARIIDGKHVAARIRQECRERLDILRQRSGVVPGLAVVLVGENPASKVYVANTIGAIAGSLSGGWLLVPLLGLRGTIVALAAVGAAAAAALALTTGRARQSIVTTGSIHLHLLWLIVTGVFVYTIVVLPLRHFSALAGGIALAMIMIPIVARTTEEMIRLVPHSLREGALALGAPQWRVTMGVVVPAAASGIATGAMLAIARISGETAPLLFTIGTVTSPNGNLLEGTNTALSAQIFVNARQPFDAAIDRAWGAALTLIVLVFVLTAVARLIARRFTVR